MKALVMILALTGVITVGCNTTKEVTEKKPEKEMAQEAMKLEDVGMDFQIPKEIAPLTLMDAEISGNMLMLKVNYSGGCEEHEYRLVTKKLYKKSLPPQLDVYLLHDNKGDSCREIVEKDLKFDITEARYPSDNTKEVILLIHTGQGDPHKISYKYQ